VHAWNIYLLASCMFSSSQSMHEVKASGHQVSLIRNQPIDACMAVYVKVQISGQAKLLPSSSSMYAHIRTYVMHENTGGASTASILLVS
jgi:hypothetical protein